MPKLSDTQLVILSNAAQRDDLSVLPLPEDINLKGGALNKVMDSLRNRGLIGGDGGPERAVITSAGMAAIGVEAEGDDAPAPAHTGATTAGATARPTPRRPPPRPTARPSRPGARARRRPPRQRRPPARPRRHPPMSRPRSPRPAPAPSRRR